MATVYILYSEEIDSFYVGSCINFKLRLSQHLDQSYVKSFTKRAKDWTPFLLMENLQYEQSRQIELHIKKMKSRKYLKNLREYPEMQEKLKLRFCAGSFR